MSFILSEGDKALIKEAIERSEKLSSGEICIYFEKNCKGDAFEVGLEHFKRLKLDQTAKRNGTLIYIAFKDKVFSIIGDEGIHAIVGQEFWDAAKEILRIHFQNGEIVTGLVKAVEQIGHALTLHFPYEEGDINELSNDIIMGDDE